APAFVIVPLNVVMPALNVVELLPPLMLYVPAKSTTPEATITLPAPVTDEPAAKLPPMPSRSSVAPDDTLTVPGDVDESPFVVLSVPDDTLIVPLLVTMAWIRVSPEPTDFVIVPALTSDPNWLSCSSSSLL